MPTDDAMQDRYVGDIGDYVKLSILRALSPGCRLGIAWWLFPDENHNKDGRHIGYLGRPDHWRHLDLGLFDVLAQMVASDRRDVRALETADVLPGAIFASEVMPVGGPIADRPRERRQWLTRVQSTLEDANMVFLDPDNGLEPAGYSHGSSTAGKSILISELREMVRPGRCLIVYHPHTRRKGGHHSEIEHWADRLRGSGFATVDALRAKPYLPRVYLLLDVPGDVRERAEQIELRWAGRITWHPDRAPGGDDLPFAPSARQPTQISVVALPKLPVTANEPSAAVAVGVRAIRRAPNGRDDSGRVCQPKIAGGYSAGRQSRHR
jgi:hypothetical protein